MTIWNLGGQYSSNLIIGHCYAPITPAPSRNNFSSKGKWKAEIEKCKKNTPHQSIIKFKLGKLIKKNSPSHLGTSCHHCLLEVGKWLRAGSAIDSNNMEFPSYSTLKKTAKSKNMQFQNIAVTVLWQIKTEKWTSRWLLAKLIEI